MKNNIVKFSTIFFLSFLALFFLTSASYAEELKKNKPFVTFHVQSAYPKKLQHLGSLIYKFSDLVYKISDGEIKVIPHEPDEVVKTLDLESSVNKGIIEAAFSGLGYKKYKNPAIALFTAVPFGPPPLEYAAWMYHGGGIKLLNSYLKDENLVLFPTILLPPEASGWFNKEINTPKDLKGLKIRVYGLGRQIFENLGADTVMLAGHDIYQGFKDKKIDASEFSCPSIDKNFKFYEVAKYYYFPGWHQPATFLHMYFNKDFWKKLSPQHQEVLRVSCFYLLFNEYIAMEEEQKNALEYLKTKVTIKKWSPLMLNAFRNSWLQVIKKISKKNPDFKKVIKSIKTYSKNYEYWLKLNEDIMQ